jgi:Ca-activated chloride channel family protein
MGWRRSLTYILSACSLVCCAAYAQPNLDLRPATLAAVRQRSAASLRIQTDLVLVPVSVCDRSNRPVTGLERDHFKIFDNKVEQTVTHFAMDDEPLAVALVFDTSASLESKMRRSRMAATAFLREANPADEFCLVEFNDHAKLSVPLTQDVEEIQNRLTFSQAHGRTALFDAMVLALHQMKKSKKTRKALLVISDGGDNASRYNEAELRSRVRESDTLIYAIGIYDPWGARSRTPEEIAGPGLLTDLAEQTGGRHFPVDRLSELPDIAAKIGVELRNRYVLGYSPTDQERDGRYHHVQVKVQPPRGLPALRAFWRTGYYAPLN